MVDCYESSVGTYLLDLFLVKTFKLGEKKIRLRQNGLQEREVQCTYSA